MGLFEIEPDAWDEMEDRERDSEPQDEDYVISDCRDGVAVAIVGGGRYLATFEARDEAEAFIRERMNRESFWPSVWFVSDHGNAHLVSL